MTTLSRRKLIIALTVLVTAGLVVRSAVPSLKLYGPGLISRIMDPIQGNREVTWEAGPTTPAVTVAQRPPNIVVIVADDLGYNDLTWAGGGVANGTVATPRIDSIARDGVELSAGYTGNATCAPSRAAIMTGRYPTRFGFEFTPAPKMFMRLVASMTAEQPGVLRAPIYFEEREKDVPPMEEQGLPPNEITLAELLRAHGYRTLGLGKWHLGETPALRPEAQGFDEYLGFYAGGSMFLPEDDPNVVNSAQDFDPIDKFLWANLPFAVRKNQSDRFTPDQYMTDYLAEEAAKAIDANRNRPFFMYLAFNAPHTPLQALQSDYDALAGIENHTLRVYGAMIRALDRAVGRVLDRLNEHGLDENTLVIFTSDNGGANYVGLPDINHPYRGWKMTFFEGGVHTPFFVKWPARLPRGTKLASPAAHIDIFPTAAAAAGVALPSDRAIDGVNLLPFLRGEATGPTHEALFWRSGHYRTVLTDGWKLQVSERPPRRWLFDLNTDPTELHDLAEKRSDKVAHLTALLERYNSEQVPPAWPSLIEGPVTIDAPLGVPHTPDDEYVYWAN